jgi:hypothetical protein
MDQSQANQWIHLLLGGLRATLRTLGDAPSRSIQEWATRLAVAEAEAAAVVVPPPQAPTTAPLPAAAPAPAPAPAPASPLLATTGLHDALSAPKIRLNRRAVIVASTSAPR